MSCRNFRHSLDHGLKRLAELSGRLRLRHGDATEWPQDLAGNVDPIDEGGLRRAVSLRGKRR